MTEKPELLTKRFRLGSIGPDKVSDNWLEWTRDSVLMSQLNARAAKISRADIERYVAAAWKDGRMIIGIYDRTNGEHIGLYEIALDGQHGNATLDMLVDQQRYDLANVLRETDRALLDFLAKQRRVEKAIAQVVETYTPAIRHLEATGWQREGLLRQERQSASGNHRLDVVQFGRLLDTGCPI